MARRGLQRRTPLKMGKLITPRVTWPSFDAGLSMETTGTTPDGVQLFRYVHSTAYRVSPLTVHITGSTMYCSVPWEGRMTCFHNFILLLYQQVVLAVFVIIWGSF